MSSSLSKTQPSLLMSPQNLVSVLQMSCTDNKADNIQRSVEQIREAAAAGANIICLQELFATHYPCQSEDHSRFAWAESVPGPTTETMTQLAVELGVVLVVSVFEKRTAGIYHNTAVVIDCDGSIAGSYRKMHIPDDPNYYEKFYFTPGDLGFRAFPTAYGRIGVCICWDQWFPEAARLTAMHGAEIIFYPTAIGWLLYEKETFGESQCNAWETMLRSHAIANGVYVAAPNRVGVEGNIEFWGSSNIIDPYGNILAKANHSEDVAVYAEFDPEAIDVARTHWPFLRDRRLDAYDGLRQRFLD